jgi:glutathione S-transferase
MATHTLSVLKPSVNNLTARIFVRAAGLDYEEIDVWGKKSTPEFLAKNPADLTPMLEEDGLERGSMWESCAIMMYLCNKHGLDHLYPTDPGEVGCSEADDELKAKAQRDATDALAQPLEAYDKFFLAGQPFIGGDHPSIADIRLSATLEFLSAIDYPLPVWATEFMARMESELGDAYSEPAADVRGFVASVKTPAA